VHHPDIRQEATRAHYAELLEQARLERLAAIADAQPELSARFARIRGVITSLQLRAERRPVSRAGLNPAS
jgi:chromosome segregation and condensation protein ScpB